VDSEKVCANSDDEVNEVQEEVQEVGYLNLWAGGEWPRSMCNDEAGLEAVNRMRWPAASKLRTLAAARQVAWSGKQVTTPESAGIEAPAGWKKQEPWLLLAAGVALAIYDSRAGGGWVCVGARNRNSSAAWTLLRGGVPRRRWLPVVDSSCCRLLLVLSTRQGAVGRGSAGYEV